MKEFSDYKVNYPAEEWAPCPKLPTLFEISTEGRLYSLRSKRLVNLNPINGYLGHVTKVGGRLGINVSIKCHIEVAKAFIFNPLPYQYDQVNHIDGNKLNPMWWNLEWTDSTGNHIHARDTGLNIPRRIETLDDIVVKGRFSLSDIEYMAKEIKTRSISSLSLELNFKRESLLNYIRIWNNESK